MTRQGSGPPPARGTEPGRTPALGQSPLRDRLRRFVRQQRELRWQQQRQLLADRDRAGGDE